MKGRTNMKHKEYPLLEYDASVPAVIEPSRVVDDIGAPEHCVLCFFGEVIQDLKQKEKLRKIAHQKWEDADRPVYEMDFNGYPLVVFQSPVGASIAAAMLEELIARGCRKFMACGSAGVLDQNIVVGRIIIPSIAVRDEGTSYHYMPPGREIAMGSKVVGMIEEVLNELGVDYLKGKTWTTDAPYRETREKIDLRRAEGCLTVEMETAAFLSVAKFRGIEFGQLLYAGDDISGSVWDAREWHSKKSVRSRLFELAAEICLRL
jgi:uridine phosphorylase